MKKTASIPAFLFILTILLCSCKQESTYPSSGSATAASHISFDDYLDSLFCQEILSSTLNLHYTLKDPSSYGITDYPVTLGEISQASRTSNISSLENILAVLDSYDYRSLSTTQQLTYDILKDSVEHEITSDTYYYYAEPLSALSGTQSELPILLAEYRFDSTQDIEDYLTLLSEVPDYFEELLLFEQEKSANGLFMADFAADEVIAQCSFFVDASDDNYLITTFNTRLAELTDLTAEEATNYQSRNSELITSTVLPAYQNLAAGLTALKGSGVNEQGLCYYDLGRDYYEYLVEAEVGTDSSITELEDLTESARTTDLATISNLLQESPELTGTVSSYEFALSDPDLILDDLKSKISVDFPVSTDTSYTIKYIDSALEEYLSPAFYLTSPIDDTTENCIYINGSSNYTKLQLYTTLAHEGYPGHLYQNCISANANLPAIRSMLGCSGYTEGWATYVELLSYHYADVDSSLASVLSANQSVVLSLYASCDMGIHYDGWSLADTTAFLADYGISDSDSVSAIYELILESPANYLKYYIGYLEFEALRDSMEASLGEDFSLLSFHSAVLSIGSCPFYILEDYIQDYYTN